LKSALIAEVFGTAMYVQIGCAANCVALYTKSVLGTGSMAAVWAVATAAAIYATAALSGGHLNPAISLGFALVRPADFGFRRLIPYWMAQLLGACLAGCINLFLFYRAIAHYENKTLMLLSGDAATIESAAAFGDYWSLHSKDCMNGVHAFFIEAFGTAVLCFVVFALTHVKNPIPGSAVPAIVGAVYGVLVATLGPLTGYV
jgi:glycerol uptake facilitator protein